MCMVVSLDLYDLRLKYLFLPPILHNADSKSSQHSFSDRFNKQRRNGIPDLAKRRIHRSAKDESIWK